MSKPTFTLTSQHQIPTEKLNLIAFRLGCVCGNPRFKYEQQPVIGYHGLYVVNFTATRKLPAKHVAACRALILGVELGVTL